MIRKIIRHIYYIFFNIKFNIFKKDVHLRLSAEVKKGTIINGPVKIGRKVFFSGEIGSYSYIGDNCRLGKVKIGKFCSISPNVKVVNGNHPLFYVSTSPVFYSTLKQCGKSFVSKNTFNELSYTESGYCCEIGNDVWIGENVIIKSGVKIGDGAVIAMGAVVTHDVKPYTICGGVPAKIIKNRFDDINIYNIVKNSKWWDSDSSILSKYASYVNNPIEFIKKINEDK